jgi:hypothetical protein
MEIQHLNVVRVFVPKAAVDTSNGEISYKPRYTEIHGDTRIYTEIHGDTVKFNGGI